MFIIRGHVQNYAWGIPGGLNRWLPADAVDDQTQAELWFGAHPNGPSPLVGAEGTLADVVDADDVSLLVKVLAAQCPLSIQLHPDAQTAAQWFDAGSDLVSDPHAKEEMLVALEDFAVFAGWRPLAESSELLRRVAADATVPTEPSALLLDAAEALDAGDIDAAVRVLLSVDKARVDDVAQAVRGALSETVGDQSEVSSHELAASTFPGDNGLLVLSLLDHRVLPTHAAVYMPVGGVHAYAKGVGLEVMTSSDNVLRLGLTGKRVAVDEALSALRNDGDPHFLSGESKVHLGQEFQVDYHPEGAAFHVTLLESGEIVLPAGSYRCVLNLRGTTTVTMQGDAVALAPGQACAVLASEPEVVVAATGLSAAILDVAGRSD